MAPPSPRNIPWYRRHDEWTRLARRYMSAFVRIPPRAPHHREMAAYRRFSAVRLVFESNLIEGAGISEGETRKVVEDYFPSIPDDYPLFRDADHSVENLLRTGEEQVERLSRVIAGHGLDADEVIPSVRFEGRSRGVREVVQHFHAYHQSQRLAQRILSRRTIHALTVGLLRDPNFRKRIQRVRLRLPRRPDPALVQFLRALENRLTPSEYRPPALLLERDLRNLHRQMALGLLPEDCGVEAGAYRIDERSVGLEVSLPAPDLVPRAMKRWLVNANRALLGRPRPLRNATRLSYEFVRIHPFPDFNGRMSRLVLNVVLSAGLVPFPVVLRGDSRGRRRYLRALDQANRGNLETYETLIAMNIVEGFREVDRNLELAGLDSILAFLKRGPGRPRPVPGGEE